MIKNYEKFVLENIKIDNMNIPNDILKINDEFKKANKELFIVGGAVRDFLQGKKPHDYDLVTNALPEESKKILKDWNVSDEQGKNFGVLRIYTKDEPLGHELAVYRHDISKGRDVKGTEQKVEIGKHITMEEDSKRRDLTQNSLYYNISTNEIVDLVGGVGDLKNKVLRTVGEPAKRFEEDRLRILRIMRFVARSGGQIEKGTSEAIKKDNRLHGISAKDDVSQERIVEEVYKMMEYAIENHKPEMFVNYLNLLKEYNMFEQMFPEIEITIPNKRLPLHGDKETGYKIWLSIVLDKVDLDQKSNLIKLKFPGKDMNAVFFLKEYKDKQDDIEQVYRLSNLTEKFHVDKKVLITYAKYFNIFNKPLIKYMYSPVLIDGNKIKEQGFVGREIEIEKQRQEIERYKTKFMRKNN